MSQTQEPLDPEVAQEVIALLNKKITNLRNENAQLQSQLSRTAVKAEDADYGVQNNDTRWRSELKRRPGPEEVALLEQRLEESEQRRQESEQKLQSLSEKLEESESERRAVVAVEGALEKEIEKLCHILNERTREKEEAIARLEDQFDFRGFLNGGLVKLPRRAEPAFMTAEEKRRFKDLVTQRCAQSLQCASPVIHSPKNLQRRKQLFSANTPGGVIWADEGGGCVVPLPSVLYNGKSQTTELLRHKPATNRSYEFCGVDERGHRCTYHGTYRCIKVVKADWEQLVCLDQKLAERFLGRVVVETGFIPPMFISFIQQLYKTGALKVDYAVLQYERFDIATLREVQSTGKPPTIINAPSSHREGGKRPNEQKNQDRGEGPSKRPRLRG